jgi:hypothetical protein
MARPHMEFIQSQVLPFSQGMPGDARDGLAIRILPINEEAGDSPLQPRYPPGWTGERPPLS